MKGYKALNQDMTSLYGHIKYKFGKRYQIKGPLVMCKNGYHFSERLEDIEKYYKISKSRIFEVEAEGKIIEGDKKICAEVITLVRELTKEEIRQYFLDNKEAIIKKDWLAKRAMIEQGVGLDEMSVSSNDMARMAVAEQGYALNVLIKDKDKRVRAIIARQGYKPEVLINDPQWLVRREIAALKYRLDVLVHDKNEHVRAVVANQGYGLDILVNDPSWIVRAAVVTQGYGLDILRNDKYKYIRELAALKLKEKEKQDKKEAESAWV